MPNDPKNSPTSTSAQAGAPSLPTSGAKALAELRTDSLDELFSRDPLALSDADLDTIITELRRKRVEWQQAEAQGKRPAKKALVKAPETLDLKDLGLE